MARLGVGADIGKGAEMKDPQTTPGWKQIYEVVCHDKEELLEALEHALSRMSRDQQATMTKPTYEEALEILENYR